MLADFVSVVRACRPEYQGITDLLLPQTSQIPFQNNHKNADNSWENPAFSY